MYLLYFIAEAVIYYSWIPILIINYPKWHTAIITIIGYTSLEITTFMVNDDSKIVRLQVLMMNSIVNAIILFSMPSTESKSKKFPLLLLTVGRILSGKILKLIDSADTVLYKAKANGRNQLVVFH
ncbi:GGDEF domain-containing protein [Bacillus sp. FJAT-49732]|uniref:GGDEF domain-containing protein n=1 Tax=Lederbergia citrisecunda TaxID=2833583 RepID=A0A942TLN4_9BACI|nr:GGDEF domain-containing protein [Lederbergia citrisecunda]MBS4200531.1 GGDEF domain-containing protein [Lederbergia citrisecunda]